MPTSTRGQSARTLLKLDWEYPVYSPPSDEPAGPTAAPKHRTALSLADAIAAIAGKDPRPLLVVRECANCNGTDDALLSRGKVDNERTFLLSRWFHCVKLPVAVLDEDHPFHSLFASADPEHMFMSAADGSMRIPLESERSRVELWDTMTRVLKGTYSSEPDTPLRKIEHTLDQLDQLDQRIVGLEKEVDAAIEKDGTDSKKLKKLESELEKSKRERAEQLSAIDAAAGELKLKKPATPAKRS